MRLPAGQTLQMATQQRVQEVLYEQKVLPEQLTPPKGGHAYQTFETEPKNRSTNMKKEGLTPSFFVE